MFQDIRNDGKVVKGILLSAVFVPLICLSPKICSVIPRVPYLHPLREVANALRAIVTAHFGLDAFGMVVKGDSFAGVGLYQTLSALLVKMGYISGGRLISLAAAAATALILFRMVSKWESEFEAGLAVSLLFINPMYWDFAVAFKPESLSIFFVVFCIWQAEKYVSAGYPASLAWCIIAVFFGTLNHGWESCVLIPIGYLFLGDAKLRLKFAFIPLTVIAAVGANKLFTYISGVPPLLKAALTSYSILFYYPLFFRWNFWFSRTQELDLGRFDSIGDVYLSGILLFSLVSGAWLLVHNRKRYDRLLGFWLVSGASIPILLPKGWAIHAHYGWAMLAPASVTAAIFFRRAVEWFLSERYARTVVLTTCLLFTLITSFAIVVVDRKYADKGIEGKRSGLSFRTSLEERGLKMNDVAIVVEEDATKFTDFQFTFLIYSQIVPLGYYPVIEPCTSPLTPAVFRSLELAKRSTKRVILCFDNENCEIPQTIWK